MGVLTLLAFLYLFRPEMDAQFVILALIVSTFYGEVFAKIYYGARGGQQRDWGFLSFA